MKTLLLMRHAKSDWSADYGADHERPLNERGVRSARVMGEVITSSGLAPDHIISSTAVRARSTAEIARERGGWKADLALEERLYGSGPDDVIDVTASAPPSGRLMLVGHQPTWSVLVSLLTGERVEMKTATLAVIEFDLDDWAEVSLAPGRVVEVLQPRDHLGTEAES